MYIHIEKAMIKIQKSTNNDQTNRQPVSLVYISNKKYRLKYKPLLWDIYHLFSHKAITLKSHLDTTCFICNTAPLNQPDINRWWVTCYNQCIMVYANTYLT